MENSSNIIPETHTTNESKYITATFENPVFLAHSDHFGEIALGLHKDTKAGNSIISTFAISYNEAITMLHELINDNYEYIKEHPKSNYSIRVFSGKLNKYDEPVTRTVYSISGKDAIRFFNQTI